MNDSFVATLKGRVEEEISRILGSHFSLDPLFQKYSQLTPILLCSVACIAIYLYQNGGSGKRTPPHVGHWIPWFGSAISLGKDPDAFLKATCDKLGPIFRITAVGKDMIYVTSPELISAVYRDSRRFVFSPIRLDISEKVFGMSNAACQSQEMKEDYFVMHHHELSPKKSVELHARYSRFAEKHIISAIDHYDGQTALLLPFIHQAAFNSAAYAFFGDSLDVKMAYEKFRGFDQNVHMVLAGMPKMLLPGPYRSRDEGIDMFEEYLHKAKPYDDCSPIMRRAIEISTESGWSHRDIAAVLFTELWTIQTNYLGAAYWVIALLLQDPASLKAIKAEIDCAREAWQSSHPNEHVENRHQWMLDGSSFPLLSSAIQESMRLSSSVFSIRLVEEPAELGGYYIPKGERVLCITRAVHIDEEVHERPLEFVADRYVAGKRKFMKNGRPVANHTMPFGGGISMCEGRHFAAGELRVFAAFVLTYANIELDPVSTERPTFMTSRMGGGIMPPVGDLRVKITRRQT